MGRSGLEYHDVCADAASPSDVLNIDSDIAGDGLKWKTVFAGKNHDHSLDGFLYVRTFPGLACEEVDKRSFSHVRLVATLTIEKVAVLHNHEASDTVACYLMFLHHEWGFRP